MYYIGCHWGTENDGYICSSNWMRSAYYRRPQDFKRRILQKGIARENLLNEEYKWLQQIKDSELEKKYYNLSKGIKKGNGYSLPEKTKEKLRQANLGKKLSEETKRKIGLKSLGNKHNLGRKHTEETKQKRRGRIPWNKGKGGYRLGGKKREYEYHILDSNGNIFVEYGLNSFCKERGIQANNLRKRGKAQGYEIIHKKKL